MTETTSPEAPLVTEATAAPAVPPTPVPVTEEERERAFIREHGPAIPVGRYGDTRICRDGATIVHSHFGTQYHEPEVGRAGVSARHKFARLRLEDARVALKDLTTAERAHDRGGFVLNGQSLMQFLNHWPEVWLGRCPYPRPVHDPHQATAIARERLEYLVQVRADKLRELDEELGQ